MLTDNLRQVSGDNGRRIHHRVSQALRPLPLSLCDPDGRQMERRLECGNTRNLLLHIPRIHGHIVVKENLSLADLYALDLNDILIGVQLDIVPQTDNGNHASQLHGNLAPNHNHAVKQVSPLVHIRQRNDAVAKLQLDGIHLQQAVHILRLTHFFRRLTVNLALDLSRLQVAGNHPSSHNEHKAHAQEENGVQIRYHTQERQGASHHIHNFGKAKKLLHNSGTELRLLGSLCDQDTR